MGNDIYDRELNQLIAEGKALEGFDRFYADDVTMQENSDAPTVGKAANRERELAFFGAIEKVNDFTLAGQGFGGDRGYSEWNVDYVLKNGFHVQATQIARRLWKDGKVVAERFFYK